MSITLSAAQLCKHVLKIDSDVFEVKRRKGHFQKTVPDTVKKTWTSLEKLFPSSHQLLKENVSEKTMDNAVRKILTRKNTDSCVLYKYSEDRETRKSKNY